MKLTINQWLRNTKVKDTLIIFIVVLISIGIRVGIIYNTLGVPSYWNMATDIGLAARSIALGKGYTIPVDAEYANLVYNTQKEKQMLIDLRDFPPPERDEYMPYYSLGPGSSALMALTYMISGQYTYFYFRILEAIISSLGCFLIFLLGKELFNRKIGIIAAFVYAFYLPVAYLSTWALHDALMPFFTLLATTLFVMGARRKRFIYHGFSALTIGAGLYFQSTIIFLPVMFFIGLLIYNLGKSKFKQNVIDTLKVVTSTTVIILLVLMPWVIRNYNVTGKIFIMRTAFWQGIWEGFGEYSNPVGAVLSDEITYQQIIQEGYDVSYGTGEYDAILKHKSLKAIKEHPLWYLSLLARRLPHTFVYGSELGIEFIPRDSNGDILWSEFDNNNVPKLVNLIKSGQLGEAWRILIAHPYAVFVYGLKLVFMFLPVLLSIFAIWLMRRRWREIIIIAVVPLYFTILNMVFYVNWKTLVPGAIFYMILSAIVIYRLAMKLKLIDEDLNVFNTSSDKPADNISQLSEEPVI